MKKTLYVLFFFLLTQIGLFAISFNSVSTKYNDEIDSKLRMEINSKTSSISKLFQEKNTLELKKQMTSEFSQKIRNIDMFINQVSGVFNIDDLKVANEYFTTVKTIGTNNVYTILPPNDKSLIVNGMKIDEKSYIQFLVSKAQGVQNLVFLQYVNQNKEWKLNLISGGKYSYLYKQSPDLINLSKDYYSKKEYISSALYALSAYQLMRPTSFLQYKNEQDYMKIIQESLVPVGKIFKLPKKLNGNNVTLFKIDVNGFQNGIVPIIKYATNISLDDKEKIKNEVTKISKEIFQIAPDLKTNFKTIIFQASSEITSDPNKQYRIYNTILENGKVK